MDSELAAELVTGPTEGRTRWRRPGMTLKERSHLFGFLAPLVPLAFMRVEQSLTQADRFWSYLDQFVVLDVGERLLKRHSDRWGQAHRLVLRSGANIGELLALQHVDFEIVAAGMFAHDHAAIDLPTGFDHHRAAVLQVPQRVSDRFARIG